MKLKNDKKCSRCGRVLDLNNFGICNSSVSKKQGYCRECSREYARLKRIGNKSPEVTELKEIELLRIANKRLKDRFKTLLSLYLNEEVTYD